MLEADILLLLLTAAMLICSTLARAAKAFRDPPRHLLISCAHSDDCVIMGAEYAYGAVQSGLSVRVAYLTCSGPHPKSKIAKIRKAEALAAWSTLGVPEENFTFLDLDQSPVKGPSTYTDEDIAYAKENLTTLILSLPQNAALIIPAQGESHVDHRVVRKVTLRALVESKREDILVYETPEYNSFLSLLHCPRRTIRTVLRHVPLLRHFIQPYAGPANYVNGPPGFVFRDTPNRVAKKKELLKYFSSQDGNLLIRNFGYETPYRQFSFNERSQEQKLRSCVPVFGGCCDASALALGLSILGVTFLIALEFARYLAIPLSPAIPVKRSLLVLGGLVAGIYLVRKLRRSAGLESALFFWALALGLICAAL